MKGGILIVGAVVAAASVVLRYPVFRRSAMAALPDDIRGHAETFFLRSRIFTFRHVRPWSTRLSEELPRGDLVVDGLRIGGIWDAAGTAVRDTAQRTVAVVTVARGVTCSAHNAGIRARTARDADAGDGSGRHVAREFVAPHGMKCLQVPVRDEASDADTLLAALPRAVDFLDREISALATARDKGDSHVLVHCVQGQSRSATVVAAYLVEKRGMSVSDAIAAIQNVRPGVNPIRPFVKILERFAMQVWARSVEPTSDVAGGHSGHRRQRRRRRRSGGSSGGGSSDGSSDGSSQRSS